MSLEEYLDAIYSALNDHILALRKYFDFVQTQIAAKTPAEYPKIKEILSATLSAGNKKSQSIAECGEEYKNLEKIRSDLLWVGEIILDDFIYQNLLYQMSASYTATPAELRKSIKKEAINLAEDRDGLFARYSAGCVRRFDLDTEKMLEYAEKCGPNVFAVEILRGIMKNSGGHSQEKYRANKIIETFKHRILQSSRGEDLSFANGPLVFRDLIAGEPQTGEHVLAVLYPQGNLTLEECIRGGVEPRQEYRGAFLFLQSICGATISHRADTLIDKKIISEKGLTLAQYAGLSEKMLEKYDTIHLWGKHEKVRFSGEVFWRERKSAGGIIIESLGCNVYRFWMEGESIVLSEKKITEALGGYSNRAEKYYALQWNEISAGILYPDSDRIIEEYLSLPPPVTENSKKIYTTNLIGKINENIVAADPQNPSEYYSAVLNEKFFESAAVFTLPDDADIVQLNHCWNAQKAMYRYTAKLLLGRKLTAQTFREVSQEDRTSFLQKMAADTVFAAMAEIEKNSLWKIGEISITQFSRKRA